MYKVVTPYQPDTEVYLEVECGTALEIKGYSDPEGDWPNWVLCSDGTTESYIPKQFLKCIGNQAVVLRPYSAKEFTLERGESLYPSYELNGWIFGTKLGREREGMGWAPINCLQLDSIQDKFTLDMAFEVTFEKVLDFLEAQQWDEAIDLANHMVERFPERLSDTLYYKMCCQSSAGQVEKALDTFELALNNGVFWSESLLKNEETFEVLRPMKRYQNYENAMLLMFREACNGKMVQTFFQRHSEDDGFYINLHWKNDRMLPYSTYFYNGFKNIEENVLYIQSSQVESSRGYSWNDEDHALEDVEKMVGNWDKVKGIIGTSQGGRIAYTLAVKHQKPYIGIMPAVLNSFEAKEPYPPKVRLWVGQEDYFYNNVKKLFRTLEDSGVDVYCVESPLTGHYFSEDFQEGFVTLMGRL